MTCVRRVREFELRRRFDAWRKDGGIRDVWMFIITLLVLLSLRGCGPLGIKGNDDLVKDGQKTADQAKTAADQARAATARLAEIVADNKITKAEIRGIAREQAKPSVRQVLKLIARATQICTQNPSACQRIAAGGSGTSSGTSTAPSQKPTNHRTGSRSPPPRRGGRKRPPSSGGGGSAPPPSSPPGHQRPPAIVEVKPPVSLPRPVCADELVRIGDCP